MSKIGSIFNTGARFGAKVSNPWSAISTGVSMAAPLITGGNHTTLGDIGMGLGTAVSTFNPLIGAAIMGASALGNAAFGSNVNEQAVDDYERQVSNLNRFHINARDNANLLNQISAAPSVNINKSDLGTQGWFSHKIDNTYNTLQQNNVAAMAGINKKKSDAVTRVDNLNDALIAANYAAFGGPLFDFGDGAIAYDMAKDSFIAKQLAAQNKNIPQVSNALGFGGIKFPIYDNGITFIGAGGTHGQNPYGGVLMGIAPDGQPNLVEEGEVIYNDYVFSNRLKVPKKLREKYHLKEGTFADAMNHYFKKNGVDERPNDPIIKKGLMAYASDLAMSQEEIKMKKEMKQMGLMADGGPIKSSGEGWEEYFQHEIFKETIPGYPNVYPSTPKLKAQARKALRDERERLKAIDYNNRVKNSSIYKFLDSLDDKYLNDTFIHPEQATEPFYRLIPNSGYQTSRPFKGYKIDTLDSLREGLEEINQNYARGGHLFSGEQPESSYIKYNKALGTGTPNDYFNQLYAEDSDYMRAIRWLQQHDAERAALIEAIRNGEYDNPATGEFINNFNLNEGNWYNLAHDYKKGPVHNALIKWAENNRRLWDVLPNVSLKYKGDVSSKFDKDGNPVNHTIGAITDIDTTRRGPIGLHFGSLPIDGLYSSEFSNTIEDTDADERAARQKARALASGTLLDGEPEVAKGNSRLLDNVGLLANIAGLAHNKYDPYRPGTINEVGFFNPITASPIGDYVAPFHTDINYIGNQLAQQAAATRSAIMQSSLPSRTAGLLAADFNGQVARGNAIMDAARQDYETNLRGSEFNRGTNQYNSQLGLNVAQANMQGFLQNAAQRMQQRAYNVNYDFQDKMARDQALGQNLTAIGDWFDALRREGVAERGMNVFASLMPTGNEATRAYIKGAKDGGMLTKSKRRK